MKMEKILVNERVSKILEINTKYLGARRNCRKGVGSWSSPKKAPYKAKKNIWRKGPPSGDKDPPHREKAPLIW